MSDPAVQQITLAYDGHCPVCSAYSRWRALSDSARHVVLEDVRELSAEQRAERYPGVDFDEGFALLIDDRLLSGDQALRWLAANDRARGLTHSLHRSAFAGARRARWFYPLLRAGRNLLLRLLGRSRIQRGRAGKQPR
jgi:predicted DCC family thiol-disulfide oxidoreductase YuxK